MNEEEFSSQIVSGFPKKSMRYSSGLQSVACEAILISQVTWTDYDAFYWLQALLSQVSSFIFHVGRNHYFIINGYPSGNQSNLIIYMIMRRQNAQSFLEKAL